MATAHLTAELRSAIALGEESQLARLLEAGANPNAATAEGCTALQLAAISGHSCILRTLLAAGASPVQPSARGLLPIHLAACAGELAAARLLLEAAPQTAAVADHSGCTPLLAAVAHGHEELVRLLLEAAPAALAGNPQACVGPLYQACCDGHTGMVQLLLAAAPQAAGMPLSDAVPVTPLMAAISRRHLEVVRLIVEAAPQAARVRDTTGALPIRAAVATEHECSAAMVQLLLGATPATAAAGWDEEPYTPLHLAAILGNAAAARVLVQAAPEALSMRHSGKTPLEAALIAAAVAAVDEAAGAQPGAPDQHGVLFKPPSAYLDTARPMLAVVPPDLSLPVLVRRSNVSLPLFPELALHWPLTAAQWAQVPAPCPGLGRALPAVLQRSQAEAALLVARLPPADAARLRTFALALHRSQRQWGVLLPAELAGHILSLFDA